MAPLPPHYCGRNGDFHLNAFRLREFTWRLDAANQSVLLAGGRDGSGSNDRKTRFSFDCICGLSAHIPPRCNKGSLYPTAAVQGIRYDGRFCRKNLRGSQWIWSRILILFFQVKEVVPCRRSRVREFRKMETSLSIVLPKLFPLLRGSSHFC